MTHKKQAASLAVIAFFLASLGLLLFSGCYEEGDEIRSPTEPTPVCEADPPDALQVTASTKRCNAGGVGAAFAVCSASYSLGNLGLERVSWTFPEGNPPESPNPSVEVTYEASTLPETYTWSVTACTCSRKLDPAGESCRSAGGTITFDGDDLGA